MTSFTNYVSVITVLLSLAILLSTIVVTPTLIGAQVQSPGNAIVTGAHKMGVKIISPSANTTVPSGQLLFTEFLQILPKRIVEYT